ncbi:MAG TPA: zf-HC2 domain-containing protein [Polyangiaceae bacterium]|jgi:anti-sigma factor RsiW|nr:zf-HC2 domain-containing protein [Polyangiaceae bacterium]
MTTPCRTVACLVETYLDDELEPSQLLEVEKHTTTCTTCRERIQLDRAIRMGVRRSVDTKASVSFRARVTHSMTAERWASAERAAASGVPTWRAVGLAVAATVAAVMGLERQNRPETDGVAGPVQANASASVGLDAMIDQFVDWHARPLPPEITNVNDLPGFEPYVGVPVRPRALAPFGAKLLGGRILPVREQNCAAMLQYTLDGSHRVSIYVFDPRRVGTHPSKLHAKIIGSAPVYVGQIKGWSIAAAERSGVGYAIASDLGDDASAELALAAAPAP